ncbi:hypothetical protein C4K35_4162 [Pseudomonas chlororaphis subsp. piscium]|uniref:TniQ family protein n=1 Tax=Pseudomonas chlororaphis TaxID=587753 RepID=UPI000F58EA0C|nr:TniQ family protein [Pseudomonas chlororaphis]AZC51741.1 hypothetical protein C4K35_4162 [Pseudomonas chlororaphis subsp. piscium]
MNSLTFYPLPRPQESALSLIFRCAVGNGISTAHLLMDAYQKYQRRKMINALWESHPPCELLTCHPGFSIDEQAAIRECFYTTTRSSGILSVEIGGLIFPSALLRSDLALCPSCARDGHLHRLHSFSFCDICPVHGERFIDRCPECGVQIDWLTLNNYICPCGFDLRKAPKTLFNTYTSKLMSTALEAKDQKFFSLLFEAMSAMRFAHDLIDRSIILDSCARIATNNKSFFFREIETIQDQFPSLHRRAILAPFLLSPEPTLSEYALEYLFSASQSKPQSHSATCRCGEFQFSNKELQLIFSCQDYEFGSIKHNQFITLPPPPSKNSRAKYKYPELCKSLYTQKNIIWEKQDKPGEPIKNFEHVGLQMAADLLQTNTQTVRRLINTGLLKGFKAHWPLGLITAIHLIKDFNDKYVLRSELVRRSELNGRPLQKILAELTPIVVRTTLHANRLLVYQRKHLSEELRIRLDKHDLGITQPLPSREGLVNYKTAGLRLNMPSKDVLALRKLGILHTTPYRQKQGAERRELCTPEGMAQAIAWRNSHVTISEIETVSGHTSRLIHARFVDTGAVSFIQLERVYVTVDDAKKIIEHLRLYTTATAFRSNTGLSATVIAKLIESSKLNPLPPEHPDAIEGLVVIKIEEAQQAIREHNENHPIRASKVRIHNSQSPQRRQRNHYLTNAETLNVIAKSIGAFPIQQPFNINNE